MKKIILLFIVTGILVGMVTACGSGYCCDSAADTEYLSGGFGGYGYVCVSGCIG